MGHKKKNQEQRQQVLRLYDQGKSKIEIVHETGISRATVYRILLEATNHRKAECLLLIDEGMSPPEVAKKLNISFNLVSRYLPGYKYEKPKKVTPKRPGPQTKETVKKHIMPAKIRQVFNKKEDFEKVCASRPAIKEGTRPVKLKNGTIVYAPISEPSDSVQARYDERFRIKV